MIALNPLLITYLVLFASALLLELWIERLNIRHLHRHAARIPEPFKNIIDLEKFARINRYTIDNHRFGMVQTIVGRIFLLTVVLGGALPWLADKLSAWGPVWAGLLFWGGFGLVTSLVDLPFAYYHSFRIEERYGFNTCTLRIWIGDLLKSLGLGAVLGGLLLAALLSLIEYGGPYWWVVAWGVFFGFQLLIALIFPNVIAPLFNRFTPLEPSELKDRIEVLARAHGMKVSGIFQMDATRRTRHSNAYFAGLGRTKRIVLYDSLLAAHGPDEILAILAHEIGHYRKHHIKKQLLMAVVVSGVLFYWASKMILWPGLYSAFGFSGTPAFAGMFVLSILLGPAGFFLSPLSKAVSRRFERQADAFAAGVLEDTRPLVQALKKMARENLANLLPHPWYVVFNYSHPPLLERVRLLSAQSGLRGGK